MLAYEGSVQCVKHLGLQATYVLVPPKIHCNQTYSFVFYIINRSLSITMLFNSSLSRPIVSPEMSYFNHNSVNHSGCYSVTTPVAPSDFCLKFPNAVE